MTVSPEQLADALQSRGIAEVDISGRRRAEYSSDASLYRVVPRAVVFPRSTDDIIATYGTARDLGVPIVARGAGTSIAGNAIGTGVIIETSRHLNRVIGIDPDAETADVQPGVVLDDLQRAAKPFGLRFGPDPSTHNRCTIGGMIGNNACGSRALRYGRTADNVVALDVLTGAGERLVAQSNGDPSTSPTLAALHRLANGNLELIRTELGRFTRQVSGYSLEHLLPEHRFDVAKALVGTEGTCALTLQATLRLVPAPAATALVVLGYADMATAADDVPALLPLRPVAIEGLDARIVEVVRRTRGPDAVPPLPDGRGWLLVEVAGAGKEEAAAAAQVVIGAATPLASRHVIDPGETRALWRIREDGAGLAARPYQGRMAHAGWEDAAVPPDRLGAYLRELDRLLGEYRLTGVPYGHFGDGCLHMRLDFDLGPGRGTQGFRDFLLAAARLVAAHGGSMSGEHGDGRARSELLPLMYSQEALQTFADVKEIFDPHDLLNPGVVVRPRPVDADLRLVTARPLTRRLALKYDGDGGDFSRAVHRCTGVGRCRADTTDAGGVMCPSYLATRDEKDSTRGRAHVLQEMANGSLVEGWRAAEVRQSLDLCLACKGCSSDCPTGVDMATYKAEVLHQAYRGRLRPRSHYALGRLPTWARLASKTPRLANALMSSRAAGTGKWLAGVDRRRELPTFAQEGFRRWFDRRPRGHGEPVALWVDTFTEHFAAEVGKAAVRVLEDAGYAVQLPPKGLCCGLTLVSTGQLDNARRKLAKSLDALAPMAHAGIPIVGLEPSCVAVFRGDAAHLLGHQHPHTRVGAQVQTLAELLAHRDQWQPPDLAGRRIVAQPHCHHHAVMGWSADEALLERAGATVHRVGGCCGLAGNFGAERGHYDVSVAVAETALLPAVSAMAPDDVLVADGFSCRTQLDHLAPRSGQHLAQLLAGGLRR